MAEHGGHPLQGAGGPLRSLRGRRPFQPRRAVPPAAEPHLPGGDRASRPTPTRACTWASSIPKLFDAVQKKLAKNRVVRRKRADRPAGALLTGRIFDGEGRPFSPTFSSGRTGRIHRYYVAADLQQGRANDRPDAIRRVGADALEKLVLCELGRLADRPSLGAPDLPALLRRLELRATDTQLVLDQEALFGLDHPELALEDLRSRLRPGERLVVEPTSPPALRISLPRRMQLRGGRTWITAQGDGPAPARPDAALDRRPASRA